MNFWEFFWLLFWSYILVSVIILLVQIYIDVFRDHTLNGWGKALWVLFLVFIPLLAALIYLITRGRGMAERRAARAAQTQEQVDGYIRSTAAATSSATDEIAKAKALLDSNTITQAEYDALKAKALA